MQLVLATLNFPPAKGGIENLCAELATALHALGVEVHVLGPHSEGDAAYDAAVPYRVSRYTGGAARHVNLARALEHKLREGHRHVLFGQWTAAGLSVAGELLARRGVRFAALGHAKEFLPTRRGVRSTQLFERYRRELLRRLDPVLCVSRYTAAAASAAGATHVEVVHPGVDAARFAPAAGTPVSSRLAPLGRPVVLTVARLVTRKGIDTVIEALPAVLEQHPQLTYAVVGDGPDRARLQALAAQCGVAAHVAFLGSVSHHELPELYRGADVFVLASRQESNFGDVEGFGLVLLEAQACGTPVIAADSGGMPDALVPGQTGWLVPPSSPAALSAALQQALSDPSRRAAMSQAAREHALGCSWQSSAEHVVRLLGL